MISLKFLPGYQLPLRASEQVQLSGYKYIKRSHCHKMGCKTPVASASFRLELNWNPQCESGDVSALGRRQLTERIPVEGEPLDSVAEHHTRRHQQLGKVQRLDALVLVLLELDPRRGQ